MRYRRLPGTDLEISEIGFGCGGNAGLMVRGEPADQRRIVALAIDLGINYFDNAPDYGDGLAEENLGRALRELKQRPLLNSKVEIRQGDLGDIGGHILRSVEGSLRRLGVDCLDILQIHNGPTAAPPRMEGRFYGELWIDHYLRPGGVLEGLRRLVRDGKARHVGFVCRGNDGAEVRTLLESDLFRMINVPYTLLNPTAGRALPKGLQVPRDYGGVLNLARSLGAGAAVYSPLAGGILTDDAVRGLKRHRLARDVDPASESARQNAERAASFRFLADSCGISLAQAAYRFVLLHPGVTCALGGFSSIEQLQEVAATSGQPAFSAELMARIEEIWAANLTLP